MALAQDIGKAAAHTLVEAECARARKETRHLRDVLGETNEVRKCLSSEALEALFDPRRYLGMAEGFVDRVVASSKRSE
jgi:3-carboxy-cis,cis-muconate cycloisomerase